MLSKVTIYKSELVKNASAPDQSASDDRVKITIGPTVHYGRWAPPGAPEAVVQRWPLLIEIEQFAMDDFPPMLQSDPAVVELGEGGRTIRLPLVSFAEPGVVNGETAMMLLLQRELEGAGAGAGAGAGTKRGQQGSPSAQSQSGPANELNVAALRAAARAAAPPARVAAVMQVLGRLERLPQGKAVANALFSLAELLRTVRGPSSELPAWLSPPVQLAAAKKRFGDGVERAYYENLEREAWLFLARLLLSWLCLLRAAQEVFERMDRGEPDRLRMPEQFELPLEDLRASVMGGEQGLEEPLEEKEDGKDGRPSKRKCNGSK